MTDLPMNKQYLKWTAPMNRLLCALLSVLLMAPFRSAEEPVRERHFRFIVGVEKNVRVRLEVRTARLEKTKMGLRDQTKLLSRSIGIQCRITTAVQPELEI